MHVFTYSRVLNDKFSVDNL